MKRNTTIAGRFALTALAAAAVGGASPSAWALGLGRLQVSSSLGEALRAEIDITSLSSEEAADLRLRVASPDAYRAAGVEYNAVLTGTQVELRRRSDGRPFLRLTSDRGVQEPFVDVILEINWSSGRLVREYTLLFDPPTVARSPVPLPAAANPAPMSQAELLAAQRLAERRAGRESVRDTGPSVAKSSVAKPSVPAIRESRVPAVGEQGDETAGKYRVKAGDSLSRIAAHTQRAGITLDQMLVSLYRENPQAFMDNNMNRLKSGAVLAVPSAKTAQGMSVAEATQFVQSQSADFGAYRQRLAAGVPNARVEESSRRTRGNVQTSGVAESGAVQSDKLTLTKGAAPSAASSDESLISKQREKEVNTSRVAELSKNLADLKQLSGATAAATGAPSVDSSRAQQPSRSTAVTSPTVDSVPVPASVAVPAVTAVAPAAIPSATSPPAVTPTSNELAGAGASAVNTPVTVPASRSSAVAVVASAPLNSGKTNGLAMLLDANPAALGLGGLVLAVLAALGIYKLAKRARRDSGETSFLESRLQPDSFFGGSGGQRIDTRDASGASSSMSYSLSQLDAIGDVDPVAEADVYLAYGRDLQAEEILKEAMRSTPQRMAIRTKLLEVYLKRRDTKGFELLAIQMFSLTRGEGEDWSKAQEMGAQLDPDNSLYMFGGTPLIAVDGGEVNEVLGASTMPQSVLPAPSHFIDSVTAVLPVDNSTLDLELELDLNLDLDLGDPQTGSPTSSTRLDSPLDITSPHFALPEIPRRLDLSAFGAPASSVVGAVEPRPFDLAEISFDLDLPDNLPGERNDDPGLVSVVNDIDLVPPDVIGDVPEDAMARKLELAEEFRQIGDSDGARDLLLEVVIKGSGTVKSRAERMLAALE